MIGSLYFKPDELPIPDFEAGVIDFVRGRVANPTMDDAIGPIHRDSHLKSAGSTGSIVTVGCPRSPLFFGMRGDHADAGVSGSSQEKRRGPAPLYDSKAGTCKAGLARHERLRTS